MRTHALAPFLVAVLVVGAALGSCSVDATEETTPPDVASDIEAAEVAAARLCPVLWSWVKEVGGLMNELSAFGVEEPDPDVRKDFYASQISRIAARNAELGRSVADLDGPVLAPIVQQVRSGLVRSAVQIDEMLRTLEEMPELDEMRPQVRISMLFIAAEKLIDAPKPSLARYDDPSLIAGFQRVRECQHSVKDVDDGVPRFNG